jgi:hypothetical protein
MAGEKVTPCTCVMFGIVRHCQHDVCFSGFYLSTLNIMYVWQLRMSQHMLVLCLVLFTSVSMMYALLISYLRCQVEHHDTKLDVP